MTALPNRSDPALPSLDPSMASVPEAKPAPAPGPRPRRRGWLLAHSAWDVIPVLCGVLHLGFVLAIFAAFPLLPWWGVLRAAYSVSISWNINGISHNFIHNPYFTSPFLNRAFSLMESVTMGFSQTFYDCVHTKHHIGNSDRPDAANPGGTTIDWLSIYRHGKNGLPENVWAYTFLSFFRDDPKKIYREIARKHPGEARFGVVEIVSFLAFFAAMGVLNWKFIVCFLPFWYLGHCLSYLNGYFEHYAGDPDTPIAWGVSTYHRLYNLAWFNNGYHAEHHFRPRHHWTRMHELHKQIERQQAAAGTRVIRPPHALGFLDPDLPSMTQLREQLAAAAKISPRTGEAVAASVAEAHAHRAGHEAGSGRA